MFGSVVVGVGGRDGGDARKTAEAAPVAVRPEENEMTMELTKAPESVSWNIIWLVFMNCREHANPMKSVGWGDSK